MPNPHKPSLSKESNYWREYFDQKADTTDVKSRRNGYLSNANARLMHHTVQKTLGSLRDQRILDVGCGDGDVTSALTIQNAIIGLDLSSRMLNVASTSGGIPVCADMLEPPFPPNSFDTVICVEAMTCLSQPLEVLPILTKMLRPGGSLLIGGLNFHSMLRRLIRPLTSTLGTQHPRLIMPGHCRTILDDLGVHLEPTIWITYYPGFSLQGEPSIMTPIIKKWATNFLIKGLKR